ncbi:nephrin, partial [Lates japonicus]
MWQATEPRLNQIIRPQLLLLFLRPGSGWPPLADSAVCEPQVLSFAPLASLSSARLAHPPPPSLLLLPPTLHLRREINLLALGCWAMTVCGAGMGCTAQLLTSGPHPSLPVHFSLERTLDTGMSAVYCMRLQSLDLCHYEGSGVSGEMDLLSAWIASPSALPFLCLIWGTQAQQAFRSEPRNLTVWMGATAVLRCEVLRASGTVQWVKDGLLLGPERSLPGFPRYSMIGNPERGQYHLQIEKAQLEDDALYQCQAGQSESSQAIVSNTAWVTMLSEQNHG